MRPGEGLCLANECAGLELACADHIFDFSRGARKTVAVASFSEGFAGLVDGPTVTADFNLDGRLDVSFIHAMRSGGVAYIWNPGDDRLLYESQPYGDDQQSSYAAEFSIPAVVAGKDATSRPLLVFSTIISGSETSETLVSAHQLGSGEIWRFSPMSGYPTIGFALMVFDLNGDGIQEVIVHLNEVLYVIRADETLANGDSRVLSSTPCGQNRGTAGVGFIPVPYTGESLIVAFCAGNPSGSERMVLFGNQNETFEQPFRNVGARAGLPTLLGPNAVPLQVRQDPTMEWPEGSGQRLLNTFYGDIARRHFIDLKPGEYPAMDARVTDGTLLSANEVGVQQRCGDRNTSFRVSLTIENVGSSPMLPETPVTFYFSDPLTDPDSQVLATRMLGGENLIAPGTSRTITFDFPDPNITFSTWTLYAVANDDGQGDIPLSVPTRRECIFDRQNVAAIDVVCSECGNDIVEANEVCDDGAQNGVTTCGCQSDCFDGAMMTLCDDGLFCTGEGACDGQGGCIGDPLEAPCDTPLLCNEDVDMCDECQTGADCVQFNECFHSVCRKSASQPVNVCVGKFTNNVPCTDDGFFCTGAEMCSSDLNGCVSVGSPCANDEICDEARDRCVECVDSATGSGIDEGCSANASECNGNGNCVICEDDKQAPAIDSGCSANLPECQTIGDLQVCVGCDEDSDCSNDGQCNIVTGQCVQQCGDGARQPGEACDDGDGNGSTPCGCQSDCTFGQAGVSCDDRMFCTVGDACNGIGQCEPGTDGPCEGGGFCNEIRDVCDECESGLDCEKTSSCIGNYCVAPDASSPKVCVPYAAPVGSLCKDDEKFCNGYEVCDAIGRCVSTHPEGGPPFCPECNEETDECGPCSQGSDCPDGITICAGFQCVAQKCVFDFAFPGTPCLGDGRYCAGDAQCNAFGACVESNDGPCEFGEYCVDGADQCVECRGDSDCLAPENPCEQVGCNDTGECVTFTLPVNTTCDSDGAACNGVETCQLDGGIISCQSEGDGGPVADGNPCDPRNPICENVDGGDYVCSALCGDEYVGGGEECDEGIENGEDARLVGCSNDCDLLPGWYCRGDAEPPCPDYPGIQTVCGDGIVAGVETCDDGNNIAGDACDPDCGVDVCSSNTECDEPGTKCDAVSGTCVPDCAASGTCPECETNAGCAIGERCDGSGTCRGLCETNSACSDGQFCNGEERCDSSGYCAAGDDPCETQTTCDEATRECLVEGVAGGLVASGSGCSASGSPGTSLGSRGGSFAWLLLGFFAFARRARVFARFSRQLPTLFLGLGVVVAMGISSSAYAAPEICDDGVDNDDDGYIDAFDNEDCGITVDCRVEDETTRIQLVERYRSPTGLGFSGAISFGDFDKNGRVDIAGYRRSFDDRPHLVSRAQVPIAANLTDDEIEYITAKTSAWNGIAVAEIDPQSEGPELILTGVDESQLFVMPGTGGAAVDALANVGVDEMDFLDATPVVADLDGDGRPEIILGNGVFSYDPARSPALTVVAQPTNDLPSGSSLDEDPFPADRTSLYNQCAIGDFLQPGEAQCAESECSGLELACANHVFDFSSGERRIVRIASASTGIIAGLDAPTVAADFDLDGSLDIAYVVSRPNRSKVYIWNPRDDRLLYESPYFDTNGPRPSVFLSVPTVISQPDGSGRPLLAFTYKSDGSESLNVVAHRVGEGEAWRLKLPTRLHRQVFVPTAFDFDGDGGQELLIPGDDRLLVMDTRTSLSAADSRILASAQCIPTSGSTLVMQSVRTGEVLIGAMCDTGNSYRGILRFFANLNENLEVPYQQAGSLPAFPVLLAQDASARDYTQNPTLEWPAGSGEHWLNTYHAQPSRRHFTNLEPGEYPAIDARVIGTELLSAEQGVQQLCGNRGTLFRVALTIENAGDSPILPRTPVTFYFSNPFTNPNARALVTVEFGLDDTILPGTTEERVFEFRDPNITFQKWTLYAVVNDDGQSAVPLTAPTRRECVFDQENLGSIEVLCNVCGNEIVEVNETCDDGAANGQTACGCQLDCHETPMMTLCDDGVFCTLVDVCDGQGACIGDSSTTPCKTPPLCREDIKACDECQSDTDCLPVPECARYDCDPLGENEAFVCAGSSLKNVPCTDDGLFCSGVELCNGFYGCASSGNPCGAGRVCDEDNDRCLDCIDSSSGSGIDEGCRTPTGECDANGQCVVCEDDAETPAIDGGCSAQLPVCDTSGVTPVCVGCDADSDCGDGGQCNLSTGVCAARCGDGVRQPGEACDRGEDNGLTNCGCQVDCTFSEAGAACDDRQFCTVGDVCNGSGECEAGTGDPCESGKFCNELRDVCDQCETGLDCGERTRCRGFTCQAPDAVSAKECLPFVSSVGTFCESDGSFCNGYEVCDAVGRCVSTHPDPEAPFCPECNEEDDSCGPCGSDADCPATLTECSGFKCFARKCTITLKPSGTPCLGDGRFCAGDGACNFVGACEQVDESPCAIGELCIDGEDRCVQCRTSADCIASENSCEEAECNADGQCVYREIPESSVCAPDGSLCNGTETCQVTEDGVRCLSEGDGSPNAVGNPCDPRNPTCENTADGNFMCSAVCGDAYVGDGEECDEGVEIGDDATLVGCSTQCLLLPGWYCVDGSEPPCPDFPGIQTVCGDGIVAGPETCDDGNEVGGDGCAADCGVVDCRTDADCDELGATCDVNTARCIPNCGSTGTCPECETNADCAIGERCDGAGICRGRCSDDAPCSDSKYCNGAERCDVSGYCAGGEAPCGGSRSCSESRQDCSGSEGADNQLTATGGGCASLSDADDWHGGLGALLLLALIGITRRRSES